jgi:hypothetical protein
LRRFIDRDIVHSDVDIILLGVCEV